MKYYIVGISTRATFGEHISRRVYGDALVHASDKHEALGKVRRTGWVPNPGDIWLLGGDYYKERLSEDFTPDEIELAKDKAREEGVAILWSSGE